MENLMNKNREPCYRLPVPEDIMKAKVVGSNRYSLQNIYLIISNIFWKLKGKRFF